MNDQLVFIGKKFFYWFFISIGYKSETSWSWGIAILHDNTIF